MVEPYYQDAFCTIYHGDCREIVPELADGAVDMVLTDPPYGLGIGYGRSALGLRTIENDTTTDLLLWVVEEAARVLADDRWAAVFCGYSQVGDVQQTFAAMGLGIKTVGVWDKGMPTLGAGIRNQYELFVLARKGNAPDRFTAGNVWRCTQGGGRPVHPHEKPGEILRRLIENYSEPGGLVLDPCMGSGTTLRAAKDCGRKAIGIELEEHYCEVAALRLRQEVLDFGGVA